MSELTSGSPPDGTQDAHTEKQSEPMTRIPPSKKRKLASKRVGRGKVDEGKTNMRRIQSKTRSRPLPVFGICICAVSSKIKIVKRSPSFFLTCDMCAGNICRKCAHIDD